MTTLRIAQLGGALLRLSQSAQRLFLTPLAASGDSFVFFFSFSFCFSETGNKWDDRANFSAKSGKYTLLEMDNSADEEEEARLAERLNAFNSASGAAAPGSPAAGTKFRPSELDPAVQELMALCFDTGMFQQTMKTFEIDTAKMRQWTECATGRPVDLRPTQDYVACVCASFLTIRMSFVLIWHAFCCFLLYFLFAGSPGQAEQGADREGLRHPHGDRIGAQERQPLQAQRVVF